MRKHWTAEEIETWLIDAALALKSMPDRERAWLTDHRNWWPETIPDADERFALLVEAESNPDTAKAIAKERNAVRTLPSPEQIDRLNVVMGWFRLMPGKDAVFIVWSRACGFGWAGIGHKLGQKRQNVRYRHRKLLGGLVQSLNREALKKSFDKSRVQGASFGKAA